MIGLVAKTSDVLQPEHELRLSLDSAALDLVFRGSLFRQPLNLFTDRAIDFCKRPAGSRRGRDLNEPGQLSGILCGRNIRRDSLVVHETAIEAGRLSIRQHVGREIQGMWVKRSG